MLHILVGDGRSDTASVFKAGRTGEPLLWIVPKKARVGDRVLFHLPLPHGFAAPGSVDSEPQPDKRWTHRYSGMIGDITLLPVAVPLPFIRDNHESWKWPTYPRGYATIDGSIERRLDELLDGYQASFVEPLTEGTPKTGSVTTYERNPVARQQCIEHYGSACFACGLSFGDTYGETAEGYIHVHHLENISSRGGKHVVDPVKDLRPVCPNCHVVIHRQSPPLSIAKLKKMLKAGRSGS